jgi:gliding motility-associated-like protein
MAIKDDEVLFRIPFSNYSVTRSHPYSSDSEALQGNRILRCSVYLCREPVLRIQAEFIMRKPIISLALFLLFPLLMQAQMLVSNTMTPAQFVQNVLVGPGVTISNVTYNGHINARGTFTTGAMATNIGFASGVILSSGSVFDAPGPNSSGSTSTALNTGGDPQLAALIPSYTVLDATVLEFDFIPLSDTIKFRYVFASEEWPEFSGSTYNDVFGFFLSGINPLGGMYTNKNLAVLPNTSIPVAINNVNNGTANMGPCNNCQYYVANASGITVEYDAFTTVLTAWALVFPCMTYHIKLAVADAGDQIYDSSVFLEANSFMSNAVNVTAAYSSPSVDTVAVEGCNDAILTFSVPNTTPSPRTIYYGITGSAQNGIDYLTIPAQVTIPANQNSVSITISPILDGIVEPMEQVILIVNTSPCTYDTIRVFIKDNSFLQTYLPSDTVICADTLHLQVMASGGKGPYSYNWSNGDTLSSVDVFTAGYTWYWVETSDICGQLSTDSIEVTISAPVISLVGDTICVGEGALVTATAPGAVNWSWNTGHNTPVIITTPLTTTTYTLIVTDTVGCTDTASVDVIVNPLPVVTTSADTGICEGDTIHLHAWGGLIYNWSNGAAGSPISVAPGGTGSFTVSVTDVNGCEDLADIHVLVVPVPQPDISAAMDTICKGESITLQGNGGSNYLWSTGSSMAAIIVSPESSTQYTLSVSNTVSGTTCSGMATFDLGVKRCNTFFVPNAFSPDGNGLNDQFGLAGVFKTIDYFSMYIYDRWGYLVYHTDDINQPWDGTDGNGSLLMAGTYAYRITIKETYADPILLQGAVTLLR